MAHRSVDSERSQAVNLAPKVLAAADRGVKLVVGESPAMKEMRDLVSRVADSDAPVLVTGDTGSGKEWIARAIHDGSPRREYPFVDVNIAAIAETMVEAECFGWVKGAHSMATADKAGHFEMANHGTIFLDEIGELAVPLQAKLLRVLQEKQVLRVGESIPRPLDLRVVAATNKDLAKMVEAGTFREDLYHRLGVISIQAPSLRDRPEDIPALVREFLRRLNEGRARAGRPGYSIEPDAIPLLAKYPWNGNVRELENFVEATCVLRGPVVRKADVADALARHVSPRRKAGGRDVSCLEALVDLVCERLRVNRFRIALTASSLNRTRQWLSSFIRAHKLHERLGFTRRRWPSPPKM